jgi:hypothetical protein
MNKNLIINYIDKITKFDIEKYISKENIEHTKEEIDYCIEHLVKIIEKLRNISPIKRRKR